jgi:hypothetical protein
MKSVQGLRKKVRGNPGLRSGVGAALPAILLAACLGGASTASGQVGRPAIDRELNLSAGGAASGYYVQFGARKLLGISAFADGDKGGHIGIEAEARWLVFHEKQDVHTATYSIGPRYHVNLGKLQPYAKGLIGVAEFSYPFNYARGNYLVATGGGGADFRISRRICLRLADVEYQYWPGFIPGAIYSVGVSSGVRVRVF